MSQPSRASVAAMFIITTLIAGALACNVPQPAAPSPAIPTAQPQVNLTPVQTEGPSTIPTLETLTATSTPTVGPTDLTAVPSATPSGPTYGALLYLTDFTTGWVEVTSGERGHSRPVASGYEMAVGDHWGHYVYTARVEEASFYAEADVTPTFCPPSRSGYGLMFHFRGDEQFRAFLITCEGSYIVLDHDQETTRVLTRGALPQDIAPSAGNHTLGVQALNRQLTFYVDGVQVAQVEVEAMPAGDVGLYVKTEEEAITVIYTRLAVFAPQ